MAKAKQRSSSASQRREEVKKQRQQRISSSQNRQSQPRGSGRGRSKQKQRPWGLIVGTLLVIAAIIGVFIYLSHQSTGSGTGGGNTGSTPTSASVLNAVTHVSPTVLANVGTGGQQKILVSLKGGSPSPLLGPRGKPEFFYMGAEYCPLLILSLLKKLLTSQMVLGAILLCKRRLLSSKTSSVSTMVLPTSPAQVAFHLLILVINM